MLVQRASRSFIRVILASSHASNSDVDGIVGTVELHDRRARSHARGD
jgi:hypothetical protein